MNDHSQMFLTIDNKRYVKYRNCEYVTVYTFYNVIKPHIQSSTNVQAAEKLSSTILWLRCLKPPIPQNKSCCKMS
jgi:hypothetical protein